MRLLFCLSACVAAITSIGSCGQFGSAEGTKPALDGGDASSGDATRYLVAVGALPADGGLPTRSTALARLRSDGTVENDWTDGPELPADVHRYGLLTTLGAVHVFGGYPHDSGTDLDEFSTSTLSDGGTLSPFMNSALPGRLSDSSPVIARERAYAIPP